MRSEPTPIVVGQTPAEAIDAFCSHCNRGPDVLFITERWFASYRERLMAALPPALTDVCKQALELAIDKHRRLGEVVAFIERQPQTWAAFDEPRLAAEEEERRRTAMLREIISEVADRVRAPSVGDGRTLTKLGQAALARLTTAMQNASSVPLGFTIATMGVLAREDSKHRPIWQSFFDERIIRNDPTFVVRYLFGPEAVISTSH
jgi:hypothetical protein